MLSMTTNGKTAPNLCKNGHTVADLPEGEKEISEEMRRDRVRAVDQRVRKGLQKIGAEGTSEQLVEFYDQNAVEYEEVRDLVQSDLGRVCIAEALSQAVPDKCARLLDCAAGTGGGAEFVLKAGFKTIDALEPSRGMLDIAERKGIYNRVFCTALNPDKQVAIEDDTYGALFFSAAFIPGHIGVEHLPEMSRITKPGGVIVFNVADNYLKKAEEYKDGKLDAALQSMVEDGLFQSIGVQRGPYRFGEDSNIYTIQLPPK